VKEVKGKVGVKPGAALKSKDQCTFQKTQHKNTYTPEKGNGGGTGGTLGEGAGSGKRGGGGTPLPKEKKARNPRPHMPMKRGGYVQRGWTVGSRGGQQPKVHKKKKKEGGLEKKETSLGHRVFPKQPLRKEKNPAPRKRKTIACSIG